MQQCSLMSIGMAVDCFHDDNNSAWIFHLGSAATSTENLECSLLVQFIWDHYGAISRLVSAALLRSNNPDRVVTALNHLQCALLSMLKRIRVEMEKAPRKRVCFLVALPLLAACRQLDGGWRQLCCDDTLTYLETFFAQIIEDFSDVDETDGCLRISLRNCSLEEKEFHGAEYMMHCAENTTLRVRLCISNSDSLDSPTVSLRWKKTYGISGTMLSPHRLQNFGWFPGMQDLWESWLNNAAAPSEIPVEDWYLPQRSESIEIHKNILSLHVGYYFSIDDASIMTTSILQLIVSYFPVENCSVLLLLLRFLPNTCNRQIEHIETVTDLLLLMSYLLTYPSSQHEPPGRACIANKYLSYCRTNNIELTMLLTNLLEGIPTSCYRIDEREDEKNSLRFWNSVDRRLNTLTLLSAHLQSPALYSGCLKRIFSINFLECAAILSPWKRRVNCLELLRALSRSIATSSEEMVTNLCCCINLSGRRWLTDELSELGAWCRQIFSSSSNLGKASELPRYEHRKMRRSQDEWLHKHRQSGLNDHGFFFDVNAFSAELSPLGKQTRQDSVSTNDEAIESARITNSPPREELDQKVTREHQHSRECLPSNETPSLRGWSWKDDISRESVNILPAGKLADDFMEIAMDNHYEALQKFSIKF